MNAEATRTKSKMLSSMLIAMSLQALILLLLTVGGHVGRNVRDLALIYVSMDTLAFVFRNQFGLFRNVWARAAFYILSVAVLVGYAIIVNVVRTGLHR